MRFRSTQTRPARDKLPRGTRSLAHGEAQALQLATDPRLLSVKFDTVHLDHNTNRLGFILDAAAGWTFDGARQSSNEATYESAIEALATIERDSVFN